MGTQKGTEWPRRGEARGGERASLGVGPWSCRLASVSPLEGTEPGLSLLAPKLRSTVRLGEAMAVMLAG